MGPPVGPPVGGRRLDLPGDQGGAKSPQTPLSESSIVSLGEQAKGEPTTQRFSQRPRSREGGWGGVGWKAPSAESLLNETDQVTGVTYETHLEAGAPGA